MQTWLHRDNGHHGCACVSGCMPVSGHSVPLHSVPFNHACNLLARINTLFGHGVRPDERHDHGLAGCFSGADASALAWASDSLAMLAALASRMPCRSPSTAARCSMGQSRCSSRHSVEGSNIFGNKSTYARQAGQPRQSRAGARTAGMHTHGVLGSDAWRHPRPPYQSSGW
jgi:hypothetical protein